MPNCMSLTFDTELLQAKGGRQSLQRQRERNVAAIVGFLVNAQRRKQMRTRMRI